MKAQLSALLLPFLFLGLRGGDEPSPAIRKGLEAISPGSAMEHVKRLASDEFAGRETGQEGCEKAATYLAAEFARLGLEPFGDTVDGKRTFLQAYPVTQMTMGEGSGLRVALAAGGERILRYGEDLAPLQGAFPKDLPEARAIVDAGIVSLADGKPASAPAGGRAPVDPLPIPKEAKDAIVLVRVKDFAKAAPNVFSRRLVAGLREAGAAGALVVPAEDSQEYDQRFNFAKMFARGSRVQFGKAAPSAPPRGDAPPVLLLANAKAAEGLVGAKATFRVEQKAAEKTAANIVGRIPGSDPQLAAEHVVHSAHYDHEGIKNGRTYYGADDNASGTSCVLEIAKAYRSTAPPRRSVIFLLVSGEEKGLWGSSHFVDNPPVPLESLVADINTDMVGRTLLNGEQKPGYMLMTPSKRNPGYNTLAERALVLGEGYGFPAMPSGDIYWARSDHFNFARNGIPVMFLCNGEHEDYHRPTDTADKIDGDKIARSGKLAFHLGYEVATADARPKTLGAVESQPASRGAGSLPRRGR